MTLSKLINKAVEEFDGQFYGLVGEMVDKYDLEEIKSFLTQSLKEAYKLGKKQPHNTVEGYCCACPYDIVCMEEEIEQRVKKKLIALTQEVKNLKQK